MNTLKIQWSEFKQKSLQEQLVGFWAEDEWDVLKCPLGSCNGIPSRGRFIEFNCTSPSINTELKYACWQKLERKEWSIHSLWTRKSKIKNLINWLNYANPNGISLIDKSLDNGELSLRSYLVNQKKLCEYPKNRVDRNQNIKSYLVPDITITTFRQIYKIIEEVYDEREEYDKDIWDLKKLGIQIDHSRSAYRLNFQGFNQPWLLQSVKKFIRYSLSIFSSGECINRITSLRDFSVFIDYHHPMLQPQEIDRSLILEFITQLPGTGLSTGTIHRNIGILRTFLELCAREKWIDVPDKRLIYPEDFPRISRPLPRYVPEEVMTQLNEHIEELSPHFMRMTLILQECGMRIGELCKMPFDCLIQDSHGDWFLRYYQFKMKKEHTVPIPREIVLVIQEQQEIVRKEWGNKFPYLFPTPKPHGKGNPIKQKAFTDALNRLSFKKDIRDINGKPWHFQSHQFRHTVGTRMINMGVPHHIIQRYLGHESPEMTSRYAYIHDQTLKEEFSKFKEKIVDVTGKAISLENLTDQNNDLQWLKKNILAQSLPNGSCALPIVAGSCPHANACLTCTHFRTTKNFLKEHERQLEQTNQIIETAKNNGWHRQIEMNEKVKENLEKIITSLKDD